MKTLVTFAVSCVCGLAAHAETASSMSSMSSIRVTGTSTVAANPDRARVDVGVVTQAPQSESAVSQNARTFNAMMASLRKAFGPSAEIKTLQFTLTPDYQYHPGGAQPTLTGYTATNVVRVTIDDIGRIGDVVDTATRAGANRIPNVQFTLRDEESTRTQALREAATRAKAEADALASALGLKVNRIVAVEEAGPVIVPVRDVMFARAEVTSAATTLQPGSIEVNANVTLTVEVSAR